MDQKYRIEKLIETNLSNLSICNHDVFIYRLKGWISERNFFTNLNFMNEYILILIIIPFVKMVFRIFDLNVAGKLVWKGWISVRLYLIILKMFFIVTHTSRSVEEDTRIWEV